MEIDFLGLYSQNPAPGPAQNSYVPDAFVDSGIGSGEGNVSLSLCTSSPMEEKAVFRDFLWEKIRKSPVESKTSSMRNSTCNYYWENARPREGSCQSFVGKPVIGHSGFRYNHYDRLPISRNKFERPVLSFPASSTVFCHTDAPIFFPAQKADRKVYAIGDASSNDTRKSKGYTPTVAMARRATLARFLEKRSHRLNQQIKPHLMGRSLNWPEACDTTFTKCNKKIKSSMQYKVLM